MSDDFMRDLGHLGLTARLKRLSDGLGAGIRELYRAAGIDLEPSWHLVILFLTSHHEATMGELADALRLSQPAITKMITRMQAAGYVVMERDPADGRRKTIRLSARARHRLPVFEGIWAAGQASVREMLAGNEAFFEHLAALEDQVHRRGFAQRALERLEND